MLSANLQDQIIATEILYVVLDPMAERWRTYRRVFDLPRSAIRTAFQQSQFKALGEDVTKWMNMGARAASLLHELPRRVRVFCGYRSVIGAERERKQRRRLSSCRDVR
jgi:uncharacterized protein (DUF2062 family)